MWQSEQAVTCSGCGLPADETTDPAAEGTYVARKIVCHACAARDRKAAGAGVTHGVYYRVDQEVPLSPT